MHTPQWPTRLVASLHCLGLLGAILGLPRLSPAATFTCAASDVACLIGAIETANTTTEPDTIQLAAGTYTLTAIHHLEASEAYGLPTVTTPLTLLGSGATVTILERLRTAPIFGLLRISATGSLVLSGLTLQQGAATFSGGALFNEGELRLTDMIVLDNNAIFGGGIANFGNLMLSTTTLMFNSTFLGNGGGVANAMDGTVSITRSAIVGNGSDGAGGGLWNDGGRMALTTSTIARNGAFFSGGGISSHGQLSLLNSTVAENQAANDTGGGLAGLATLANTIVARNTSSRPERSPDCTQVISLGHNLVGDPTGCTITLLPSDQTGDPGLDAFVDDGTPGHSHYPLLATSPAVDAGDDGRCPTTDQLGQPRQGACDIGAIEFQSVPIDVVSLRQAVFLNRFGQLLVVATSSESPDATLTLTVPGCVQDSPLRRAGSRYLFLQPVSSCGLLDGQPLTVRSSLGGVVEGVIR